MAKNITEFLQPCYPPVPFRNKTMGYFRGKKIIAYARANMSGKKETVPDDLLYPRAWHCLIPTIWAWKGIAGHGPTSAHLATFSAAPGHFFQCFSLSVFKWHSLFLRFNSTFTLPIQKTRLEKVTRSHFPFPRRRYLRMLKFLCSPLMIMQRYKITLGQVLCIYIHICM